MRSGIAGQNSDVHAYAVFGQTQEPFHRRASEVRAARSGVDSGADPGAYGAARTIHIVAVQTGVMIRVFLKHVLVARGRLVRASARLHRTMGHDYVAAHGESPLLLHRDDVA